MVVATKSASELAPSYDAIVVGSGYGGGVAASRLARMGFKVAVLEQGRLWRPGDFPVTLRQRIKATWTAGRLPQLGDPTGLFHMTFGKGISVLTATGLGGGSLINAGAALRPDLGRLRSAGWPDAVLSDGLLQEGIVRAEKMLGVAPVPEPERFAKFRSLRRAASALGKSVQLPPFTVTFRPGVNASGVMQYACRNCGDCWSGCSAGAKNTIGVTYIPDAVDHGAQVFCGCRVQSIARGTCGWEIIVVDVSGRRENRKITARMLVLAAGALGTTELLLRAKKRGLILSDMLGEKFSANGDDLVFATDLDEPVHGVATGFPARAPPGTATVGPHSIAMIDLGDENGPTWVHDGTMLGVMAALAPLKNILALNLCRAGRLLRDGIYGDDQSRTQIFYVVGHDDAAGRLRLHEDRVSVDWPEYSKDEKLAAAQEKVKAMIEKMGGEFTPNPFAMKAFGGNRVIAHPLGGCRMAETVEEGVVAPDGRVFDPTKGPRGIHDGLYVCDSAAIPSSVGVSPLLTITALAERTMMLAAEQLGRKLDVASIPARPARDAAL